MNYRILHVLLVSLLFLSSCKKDDPAPVDPPKSKFIAREFDNQGFFAEYTYDAQDRLVKINGLDFTITYLYEPGKIVSDIVYDNSTGTKDTIFRVFTLQNGFMSEQTRRLSSDGSSKRFVYERNAENRVVGQLEYDDTNTLTGVSTNEYDAAGNLVKSTYSNGGGVVLYVTISEFEGNIANTLHYGDEFWGPDPPYAITKRSFTDGNGVEDTHVDYSYETDADGRIVKRKEDTYTVSNPNSPTTLTVEFEYR